MNLANLSAFRAVLLTGTVTAAAEIMGRSQPAVSRMLAKLEEELGVTLFERRKGLIIPTREAHLLIDEVERVYASLDSLKSFSGRLSQGEGGNITIASMPALGISFLPAAIGAFNTNWKTTKVVLNIQLSPKVEEWASAQQIDFGIAELPFFRSGFSAEIFSNAPYLCAVPCDHELANRQWIGPEDLRGQPIVYGTSFLPSRPLFDSAFQAAGVEVAPVVETTYILATYEFVKAGLGIGFIDPFTAAMNQSDQVKAIPFRPRIPFNVALLRPKTRPLTPAAESLLEAIKEMRNRIVAPPS
ncbi:MAG: LysR family transcriptional regulator [Ensifer sp. SSB1]|nr:LysR family transcriptional regulator [Ensifer sp. SSB1]